MSADSSLGANSAQASMASILLVEMMLGLMPFSTTLMTGNRPFLAACPDYMGDLNALIASDVLFWIGFIVHMVTTIFKPISTD